MSIDNVIYDRASQDLAKAISHAAEMQAIYSYNIANASSKNFKPIRFDQELKKAVAKKEEDFNIEDEMALMSENRLKHSALVKILSTRIQIAKKVMTLGKGG